MVNEKIKKISVETAVLYVPSTQVFRVAWSSDSQYFAVLQSKGNVVFASVYSAKDNQIVAELPIKKSSRYTGDFYNLESGSIAFSPDGKYLAAGVGIITLWDTKTLLPVRDILGPFSRGVSAAAPANNIAFSPDSKTLTVFYDSVLWPESITVLNQTERILLQEKRKIDKTIKNSAAFMAFDVETGDRRFLIKQESTEKRSVMFSPKFVYSPDGKFILSSQEEGILGAELTETDDPTKNFVYLKFRDSKTGEVIKEIQDVHVMGVTALAFNSTGNVIATGSSTGSKDSIVNRFNHQWYALINRDPIKLWDATTGKKLKELGPLRGGVRSLAFSPDDKILVSCQTDIEQNETVRLWDAVSGVLLNSIKIPASDVRITSCALSPDGRTVAATVSDKIYLIHIKK